MKKPIQTSIAKLIYVVLASGGLAVASLSHAAGVGAGGGVSTNAQVGAGAGGAGAAVGADAQIKGGADAGSDATGRVQGGSDVQLHMDGSKQESQPSAQDANRGLDQAKEQMNPNAIEREQATEATGKVESKKTAKKKREKTPTRGDQ